MQYQRNVTAYINLFGIQTHLVNKKKIKALHPLTI